MRLVGRFFLWSTFALLVLVSAWVFYLWTAAQRAVPEMNAEISVEGITGPITIARDERGIPIISANSERDAYFGLGYVHAQDRLFAMELMRRQGQGRLAELIGPLAVRADKYTRTLGLYRRVQEDYPTLHPDVIGVTESYAAGVNAWIESGHPLPVEYHVLWFEPEPWQPADSMVWQKIMGLRLSGNWNEELSDALLIEKLGIERARELWPQQSSTDQMILHESTAAAYDEISFAQLLDDLTEVLRPTTASNVWALNGERTLSGNPILASDPHLGFQAPNLWYLAGLQYPGHNIFGATVPGVPFHLIGQNDHVAWGLTTTHSDTGDLFIEKVSEDGTLYQTPDGMVPFDVREETISVKFGAPVDLTIRESHHGPIVSDVLPVGDSVADLTAENHAVALAVNVLQPADKTPEAVYRMARATDIHSFTEALRDFHAPQQNFVYADANGEIGFYSPARVPVRKSGDGTVPVPGWTGEYDWMGWIPFEELPNTLNPPSGALINANNKIVHDSYPHLIAARWRSPHRANRITQLIYEGSSNDLDSTQNAQMDQVSLMAQEMTPLLLSHMSEELRSTDPMLSALAEWDGDMRHDIAEPLLLVLWMENVKKRLAKDEMEDAFPRFRGIRAEFIREVLRVNTDWCDDIQTDELETCEKQITSAWADVKAWLDNEGLSESEDFNWGDYHAATFSHLLFGNLPLVSDIGKLRIANGGGAYTVNVGTHRSSDANIPFRQGHGPAVRSIFDLGDRTRSLFTLAGGQSGHLASPHYDDLLISWREGRYFNAPTLESAENRLILRPAR